MLRYAALVQLHGKLAGVEAEQLQAKQAAATGEGEGEGEGEGAQDGLVEQREAARRDAFKRAMRSHYGSEASGRARARQAIADGDDGELLQA